MENNQQPTPNQPQRETVHADGDVTYRVPDAKTPEGSQHEAPQQPRSPYEPAPQRPNPQYGGFPPPPPPRSRYQQAPPKVSIFKDGDPSVKTVVAFALSIVSLGGFFSRALAWYNLVVAIVALVMVIGENKIKKTRLGKTTLIISIVSIVLKVIWIVACVSCLACVGCGSEAFFDSF